MSSGHTVTIYAPTLLYSRDSRVSFTMSSRHTVTIYAPTLLHSRDSRVSFTMSSGHTVTIYAPTLLYSRDSWMSFTVISRHPVTDYLPTRVGADHQESWPRTTGYFGVGRLNESGQRLVELCSYHDLCITCIFFATKLQHRVCWRHPKSLAPTGPSHHKKSLAKLRPHSYHSTSCDTDHALICSMVLLQSKRNHRSKQRECPRINTASRTIPDLCERFAKSIEAAIHDCPTERWNHTRDPSYNSAMDAFGKRERQNPDRLGAGGKKFEPVVDAKRKTLFSFKREPSMKTISAIKTTRNNAQRIARCSSNDHCGNTRVICDGVKKTLRPTGACHW